MHSLASHNSAVNPHPMTGGDFDDEAFPMTLPAVAPAFPPCRQMPDRWFAFDGDRGPQWTVSLDAYGGLSFEFPYLGDASDRARSELKHMGALWNRNRRAWILPVSRHNVARIIPLMRWYGFRFGLAARHALQRAWADQWDAQGKRVA